MPYGQTPEYSPYGELLAVAKENYENGAYARAITQLETILPYLDGETMIDAHVLLAFNYVAIGDEASAIEHFKGALAKDPEFNLDEFETTPEIMATFKEAAQEQAYEYAGCSCFIPGIGQILKGDYTKGRAIIAASAITLAGTMISWSIADGKHSNYLSMGPDDLDKIEEAYDDYNRWRNITIVSAAAFLTVYVYSIADAMISRTSSRQKRVEERSGIKFRFENGSTGIAYVFIL
jgi:tetratricopeptide (TPR) repeat protein